MQPNLLSLCGLKGWKYLKHTVVWYKKNKYMMKWIFLLLNEKSLLLAVEKTFKENKNTYTYVPIESSILYRLKSLNEWIIE